MMKVPRTWLNKEAIDDYIRRERMEKYEKRAHQTGERILLAVVGRLLQDRVKQADFMINIDKRTIKDSSLYMSSVSGRNMFEFRMSDKSNLERTYVGKQFMLVRKRTDGKKKDCKRNISDGYKRVLRELYIWNKLRKSSNCIQLLHISLDDGKSITAVSEKFHSDVRQCLENPTPGIDYTTIIKGIAKGLEFLHKFTEDIVPVSGLPSGLQIKKIAHSDVKCANVFLREGSSEPYLADFGVSHQQGNGSFTKNELTTRGTEVIGTVPCMPPELLLVSNNKSKVIFTLESDVWSFGMTIYEIVSRDDPWAQDVTKKLTEVDGMWGEIKKAMESKRLPNWPSHITQPLQKYSGSLRKLRDRCCKYEACERITMEKVVHKLNKIFPDPQTHRRVHRERR